MCEGMLHEGEAADVSKKDTLEPQMPSLVHLHAL